MGETMKLAVPTMGEAGLESERAGHFGHCDCFTVVEIADGEITGTSEVANPPHEEGGCMRPVGLLAKAGVDAIVAASHGRRKSCVSWQMISTFSIPPLRCIWRGCQTRYWQKKSRVAGRRLLKCRSTLNRLPISSSAWAAKLPTNRWQQGEHFRLMA